MLIIVSCVLKLELHGRVSGCDVNKTFWNLKYCDRPKSLYSVQNSSILVSLTGEKMTITELCLIVMVLARYQFKIAKLDLNER